MKNELIETKKIKETLKFLNDTGLLYYTIGSVEVLNYIKKPNGINYAALVAWLSNGVINTYFYVKNNSNNALNQEEEKTLKLTNKEK